MPISLEQLIKLTILQKNHHKEPLNPLAKHLFEQEYQTLLAEVEPSRENRMAPALFEEQPDIPFVLFKPKEVDTDTPRPLIIHTHGGPHVYMDKDKPHAEIAWFLSHGYVVACPNYRGSTGYPDVGHNRIGWEAWVEQSKGKHHIYGPEDVYAVARFMKDQPFINPDKIFLRGGSFGSHINAHLLADIKLGKFENIFKGAHLSGGVKYPVSSSLPDDVPLLITHSVQDDIAPFEDARIFMEKLLLKQLASETGKNDVNLIQTYIASKGDHHLIDPQLEVNDDSSASYKELVRYLKLTTNFIERLTHGTEYKIVDHLEQYKVLMKFENVEPVEDETIKKRVETYQLVQQQRMLSCKKSSGQDSIPVQLAPLDLDNQMNYGSSMALLKLQLGERFTGNIKQDFVEFLSHDFRPIEWTKDRKKLIDAGRQILSDTEFVDQMVQMIRHEEAVLKQHPDHMVMYHVAEINGLNLYCFINLWLSLLQGKSSSTLPVISEMRLFDFMKKSCEDIDIFLMKMRRLKTDAEVFNNIPGFPERAIACVPAVTSNPHSTAACSLWWHYNPKENERAPLQTVIGDLLKIIGIYSPPRMARYLQLFEKEKQRLHGSPQSVMQQIFVPYSMAEKAAYLCQIWGEEFKANDMMLKSPKTLRTLTRTPELLEENLRNNKDIFTNFGDCEGFGDTVNGFNYTSALQIRYLQRNHESIIINSWFRNAGMHQNFVTALSQLVCEDYADFLASENTVPDFIIEGTDKVKRSVYANSNLGLFKPAIKINDEAFYLEQMELYRGLVQNPHKNLYGGIIALDKDRKTALQERLRNTTSKESPHPVYPYSLCRYLKGYTYYDLIREAATLYLLDNPDTYPECKVMAAKSFTEFMDMIDTFSIPSSAQEVEMSGERYLKFYNLLQRGIGRHEFNPCLHQFIQPPGKLFYESYIWGHELATALECVLKPARLAKEKGYGYDIEERLLGLY